MKAKLATFLILFAFWVVLSGMFDPFHLTLGVISCLLVAHFSHDLLFYGSAAQGTGWIRGALGLALYGPYLLWQIVLSNLQVARIVLHPRMLDLIDPQIVRFRTTLKRSISKVTLAQSITLTPGTNTVSINGDEFTVYALTHEGAQSLPGEMEVRVARALEGGK